jgi:GDPmannose 4,6-dehydratase
LVSLINTIRPDEVYNLAAQSHVRVSFDEPVLTGDITGLGTMRLLDAVRQTSPDSRFYQASSSEMFGASKPPQNESTNFYPRSPYGAAKLYSYWAVKNFREAYGLFAVNGILFNHESPRRGETFVTRKITRAVARIASGRQKEIYLGNLESRRDWGYAPEYVIAMWKMLQHDSAEDFVISTGSDFTVLDFVKECFEHVNLKWEDFVRFDERYLRPTEVDALVGDSTKANNLLGWSAETSPKTLARLMVDHDLRVLSENVPDSPVGRMWAKETSVSLDG